jgi:hypothetical protein
MNARGNARIWVHNHQPPQGVIDMTDTKPTPTEPTKTPDLHPITGETPAIRDRFPTGCGPGETEAQRDERLGR